MLMTRTRQHLQNFSPQILQDEFASIRGRACHAVTMTAVCGSTGPAFFLPIFSIGSFVWVGTVIMVCGPGLKGVTLSSLGLANSRNVKMGELTAKMLI